MDRLYGYILNTNAELELNGYETGAFLSFSMQAGQPGSSIRLMRCRLMLSFAVAYLGGLAPGAPFQPTIIFMMVFLAVLLIFSSKTSKFRHSVTKKPQLLGDFVPQTPGPLLSHILNTPKIICTFGHVI